MKKALQIKDEPFLYTRHGKPYLWDFNADEILSSINTVLRGDSGEHSKEKMIVRELYEWIDRYITEGPTEEFCNQLNSDLKEMRYEKCVVPPNFFSPNDGEPRCLFLANLSFDYPPEVHAANEFSKMMTAGMTGKLKRCQQMDCKNIFTGPPQAKWCSKTCGSKARVRKKRKRDLS